MNIANIIAAPWNARTITPESVKELAASIAAKGLLQPIIVWDKGEGYVYCIAGNRRLAAMAYNGQTDIPEEDIVTFEGSESEAREITIVENLQRKDIGILGEAASVCALLDMGNSAETTAAKLGKSVSWVNRRRKLSALDEAWKKRADAMDADALEKIATYPAEVQKRVAKIAAPSATSWALLAYLFDKESRDLDTAKFCKGDCAACTKRTGAEGDLFGIVDGKLGKCLDHKCYEKHHKAWIEAEVARLTQGANEVVRIGYSWEFSKCRDSKEYGEHMTRKHPCAYVLVDSYGTADIEVRWGVSAKAAKERAEAEAKAKAEADKVKVAERKRESDIEDALKVVTDDKDAAYEIVSAAVDARDENAVAYAIDGATNELYGWHNADEWANIMRTFPELAERAKVAKEDVQWYCERHPETDGEDDED